MTRAAVAACCGEGISGSPMREQFQDRGSEEQNLICQL